MARSLKQLQDRKTDNWLALVVAVPFGIIADSYGRRLVLGLNALAELLFYLSIGTIGKPPWTAWTV